jgi:hypothetical protein
MPTESLPRVKAGVGIYVFADSNDKRRGWRAFRTP